MDSEGIRRSIRVRERLPYDQLCVSGMNES